MDTLQEGVATLSTGRIATAAIAVGLVYIIGRVIYNLLFHPLARYPGPLLYRATPLGYVIGLVRGRLYFDLWQLHERYGPIVRITPEELSISSPQAWKDIYGYRTDLMYDAEELPKYERYYVTTGEARHILTERRRNHQITRRALSHGFSERSMREQEPIIGSYIDKLIAQLRNHCLDANEKDSKTGQAAKKPLNMVEWYSMTTFDVVADLALGEPLGSLQQGRPDPWLSALGGLVEKLHFLIVMRYLNIEGLLLPLLRKLDTGRVAHETRLRTMIERRARLGYQRPDFIEGLLRQREDGHSFDMKSIQETASVLLVAGSETTATLLSGVTYLLLRNPEALTKVTQEVRSAFKSPQEITLISVNSLTYMLACLNEALRRYPPVASGQPREVPRGGATVAGEFLPEGTVVGAWNWAIAHSSEFWTKPFEYRPERWLGDPEFANDKLDALQPFSVGPRGCIGRTLAYAEMRLILARVLFDFDLELVNRNIDWLDNKYYALWKNAPLHVYLTPVRG